MGALGTRPREKVVATMADNREALAATAESMADEVIANAKVFAFAHAEDGLAGNAIFQILEDGAGHLWMSGPNGISLLNRHELDAQAALPSRYFALKFYSISDMGGNTEISVSYTHLRTGRGPTPFQAQTCRASARSR